MFKSIGRGVMEIARAIDTGHAIRHGVRPRAPRDTVAGTLPSSPVAAMEPLAESDARR